MVAVGGRVDLAQVLRDLLLVAVGHEAQARADLVDEARLHPGLREDGLDRLGEAGEPVDAADEHVAHAALLELAQDLQPELGALGALKPHPEHVALALAVHADRQVAGAVPHGLPVADLDDQRVEVDDRVDGLQRPGLPGLRVLQDGRGHAADGVAADAGPVELCDVGLDLTRVMPPA